MGNALHRSRMHDVAFRMQKCEEVITLGKKGMSPYQMAKELDVPRSTLRGWCELFPDFKEAMAWSKDLEQAWWEDQGQNGLNNIKFNAKLWCISMAARFKHDYQEKKTVFTGANDGPIQVITANMTAKDAADLYQRALETEMK